MKIVKYNIAKPDVYTKDNEEKTMWQNVGTMTEFHKEDGTINRIIEIPTISLKANVFLMEKKAETKPKEVDY